MTPRADNPFFSRVHPLFWPVLFWQLRRFVRVLEGLMDSHGRLGRIHYEVTWYGLIRIHRVFAEDRPGALAALAPLRAAVHRLLNPEGLRLPEFMRHVAACAAQAGLGSPGPACLCRTLSALHARPPPVTAACPNC